MAVADPPPGGGGPDVHRLDPAPLDAWLRGALPEYRGGLSIARLQGGASNPTYRLDTQSDTGPRRYVLRKKPPGALLPSAHQVEREYRIMAALGGSAVPVPMVRGLCEDASVVGTAFYVMDHLDGRMLRDPRLPAQTPAERSAIWLGLVDMLAALHQVDPAAVGLADLSRAGDFYPRQLARWTRQYRAAETVPIAAMEAVLQILPNRLPAKETVAITHGDFRLENVMVARDAPRPLALLDWELCTLGDPLADLGFLCVGHRFAIPHFGTVLGVDLDQAGIPTIPTIVSRYCRRTGRDALPDIDVYIAFALFRLAAIAQGVHHRALAGIGAADRFADNQAPLIAEAALSMLNGGPKSG